MENTNLPQFKEAEYAVHKFPALLFHNTALHYEQNSNKKRQGLHLRPAYQQPLLQRDKPPCHFQIPPTRHIPSTREGLVSSLILAETAAYKAGSLGRADRDRHHVQAAA